MQALEKLSTLIEKARWAVLVYREASNAHGAALEGFVQAASYPRQSLWRTDPIVISLLKHCDTQTLTLQSIQRILQIVSEELEEAILQADTQLQEYWEKEKEAKEEIQRHFVLVQKAVECRNSALKGASDVWKADLDLKIIIGRYTKQEAKLHRLQKEASEQHTATYSTLLQTYYKTLNEYMASTVGHINILLNEVTEYTVSPSASPIDPITLATPADHINAHALVKEVYQEEERFAELYSQAAKEDDAHNGMYPFLMDLSIKGCGLFHVPKISTCVPVFLVHTSTDYIHAFSITQMLNEVSNGLFITSTQEDQSLPFITDSSTKRQLSLKDDQDIEEINLHLLDNVQSLQSIKKDFPIHMKSKRVTLASNGKEIHLEDKSSMFFTNKIKILSTSQQQIRRFYSLLQKEPPHSPHSASATPATEVIISWSSASFDNPW